MEEAICVQADEVRSWQIDLSINVLTSSYDNEGNLRMSKSSAPSYMELDICSKYMTNHHD